MAVYLFDDHLLAAFRPDIADLQLIRLQGPGKLLDAGYALLTRVFGPEVVDTKQTYVELLSPHGLRLDGFYATCFVAAFAAGDDKIVAGMMSGNMMWLDAAARTLQFAIGNIATSPALKQRGLRGVGTALWQASLYAAENEAASAGGTLLYSVAEAESESLGFWKRLDYLRPRGVAYLQPPLEFDQRGERIYDEQPETLVVRPLGNSNQRTIQAVELRQIVAAIYRNWAIETNRASLSTAGLARAEEYVWRQVFPKVDRTIRPTGAVELDAL